MMDFVLLVVGVMLGYLLATGLMILIVFNKRVINWYVKHTMRMMNDIEDELLEESFNKAGF